MSSFSCPHLDDADKFCLRLNKECVPGISGCVLNGKVHFIVPPEKRKNKTERNELIEKYGRKRKK